MLSDSFGPIGHSVDLYCLGFSVLELLAGAQFGKIVQGAFDAPDPNLAWMRWHTSFADKFPSLRELHRDAPDDLVVVVDHLLAKQVENRYATAAAALTDLDARHGDQSIPVALTAGDSPANPANRLLPQQRIVEDYEPSDVEKGRPVRPPAPPAPPVIAGGAKVGKEQPRA